MKLRDFFFFSAIALGLTACSNDDVPGGTASDDKDASISIKVYPAGNGITTRAIGDLSGDGVAAKGLAAESAIKQLEVWVFQGDVLDAYKSATGDEVKDIPARKGDRDIVVVANAALGEITSKATLLASLKDLPSTDISDKGLIMTAEPISTTLEAGKNYYGYTGTNSDGHNYIETTPLPITRVNARVSIIGATLDNTSIPTNQVAIFDNLKDVEVAMFNVPEKTKLFGASLASNENYKFGAKWPSPKTTYVGANEEAATGIDILTDGVAGALPLVNTQAPYYYVNESSGDNKMFIVLRAKPYKGETPVTTVKDLYTDAEGYTYYPVWINKDGLTVSGTIGDGNVYRNTQYNITLTIKGLGNPTIDPVETAFLDVKVEVTPWAVVNQNVTW